MGMMLEVAGPLPIVRFGSEREIVANPENDEAVFPPASDAVIVALIGVPAIWGEAIALHVY